MTLFFMFYFILELLPTLITIKFTTSLKLLLKELSLQFFKFSNKNSFSDGVAISQSVLYNEVNAV